MKRTISVILCACMLCSCLAACGLAQLTNSAASGVQQPTASKEGQADNEILTYTPIDKEKTTIYVSSTVTNGEAILARLSEAFEKANPDINVINSVSTSGIGTSYPIVKDVLSGTTADILFVEAGRFTDGQTEQYFENLSANPVASNFEEEALDRVAVNNNLYFLPGPSEIHCMLYNATLFDEYGWTVPKTFDEFADVCVQIKNDTNGEVQAWNPNAKYENIFKGATTAFCYDELFGGVENRTWYNEFLAGNTTFAGHMEAYYDMLQTLIDKGILTEEYFDYSATTRGKDFADGKIAFYNVSVTALPQTDFEIKSIPFPSTSGEDGYVVDRIGCLVGVPIKEHTEAQNDAIQRYLEFFSSVPGQQDYIDNTLMISNVVSVPFNSGEVLAGVQSAISTGHHYSELTFAPSGQASNVQFRQDALAMLKDEKTATQCIADNDAQPFTSLDEDKTTKLAEITEEFTILDTSCFIADVYRETADADIGLIANNVVYRGNIVRLHKGDFTDADITSYKPRSFDNKATLIKVSMTGEQLLKALNDIPNYSGKNAANAIMAYSGLKCTVAPWNSVGEKYLSVTLADGSEIDPAKTYTVAIWDGAVDAQYYTEVLETCEGTWEEIMTAALTQKGTIAPANDGRITLVWE